MAAANQLYLAIPALKHKQAAMEYRRECIETDPGSHITASGGLSRYEKYEDWLAKITDEANHTNPNVNSVPATMYFAVYNQKIVGSIQIRHYLNEPLLIRGGHIGYGVRPAERRKGCATEMLALALEECKRLGIKQVLVTCDKKNIASARTIEKNGGVLENEFVDAAGGIVLRYWIDIA